MPVYPAVALVMALLNWVSVEKNWHTLEYITKPAFMLVLLLWIGDSTGYGSSMLWFTLGVAFCLFGDVFLMIPRDLFIFGLLAFLVGHIFYIVGFNNQSPYFNLLGVIVAVLIAGFFAWFFPKLIGGLRENGKKQLIIPVFVYSVVISLMVYSAIMTWSRPQWTTKAAVSVSIGAVLFFTSDAILAWDRFVRHITHGRTINLVAYHLGQLGIVLGAIYHTVQ